MTTTRATQTPVKTTSIRERRPGISNAARQSHPSTAPRTALICRHVTAIGVRSFSIVPPPLSSTNARPTHRPRSGRLRAVRLTILELPPPRTPGMAVRLVSPRRIAREARDVSPPRPGCRRTAPQPAPGRPDPPGNRKTDPTSHRPAGPVPPSCRPGWAGPIARPGSPREPSAARGGAFRDGMTRLGGGMPVVLGSSANRRERRPILEKADDLQLAGPDRADERTQREKDRATVPVAAPDANARKRQAPGPHQLVRRVDEPERRRVGDRCQDGSPGWRGYLAFIDHQIGDRIGSGQDRGLHSSDPQLYQNPEHDALSETRMAQAEELPEASPAVVDAVIAHASHAPPTIAAARRIRRARPAETSPVLAGQQASACSQAGPADEG